MCLLISVLSAILGGLMVLTFAQPAMFQHVPKPQAQVENVSAVNKVTEMSVSQVSKIMSSCVVGITSSTTHKSIGSKTTSLTGKASGVVVEPDGYILTNTYVADSDNKEPMVSFYDGSEVKGKVIWEDPELDLCIVKVERTDLCAADLCDSSELGIGDEVVALGNPLEMSFQRTASAGIISAINHTVILDKKSRMEDLIQTDAQLNYGNNGGPLVNTRGKVVGIITMKPGFGEGAGFAIPVDVAKPVIDKIKLDGKFETPYLGIKGVDREIAGYYDLKITKGVAVQEVEDKSPAQQAGINKGDVILEINNKPVNTLTALRQVIYSLGVGWNVDMRLETPNGEVKNITVKLKAGA